MPVGILTTSASNAACAPLTGPLDTNQAGTTEQMNGCYSEPVAGGEWQCARVQMLPGVQNVQLVGAGITECANSQTNEFQVTLSLSGAKGLPKSIVLSPTPANASNQETSFTGPATALYLFSSRNVAIASCSVGKNTFSATCTITATGLQGETEITVVNPRAVNSQFTGAQASPTAGGSTASLLVRVVS